MTRGSKSRFPVLVAQNVSKIYPMGDCEVQALKEVSIIVRPGEMIAIMGTSGSGKSTLLQILGCLDRPTSGKVMIDGHDVGSLSDIDLAKTRNQKLGFIFQAFNLMPHETSVNNVEIPLQYAGFNRKERRHLAIEALKAVGLGDRLDHRPPELSGGQRQRVAVARAIVNKPVVVLADEPTGALDVKSGLEVMAILQRLNKLGRTIVIVTHDPNIAQHAGRIIKLSDGRVVEEEIVTTPKIARVPKSPEQEEMLQVAGAAASYAPTPILGSPRECSRCGIPNRSSSRFCRLCGFELRQTGISLENTRARLVGLELRCYRCGFPNRSTARFCSSCGVLLDIPAEGSVVIPARAQER